jgi:hypothetical protein
VRFLDGEIRADPTEEHILVMDQHSTHCSYELLHFAEDNHVTIYYLPSHTTHYLQPVDYSLFRPLKRAYHAAEDASFWSGLPTNMFRVPILFGTAWKKACTPDNIKAGFRGTGIFPFDPEHVLQQLEARRDDNICLQTPADQLHRGGEVSEEQEENEVEEIETHSQRRREVADDGKFVCGVKTAAQARAEMRAKNRATKKKKEGAEAKKKQREFRKVHTERRRAIEKRRQQKKKQMDSYDSDE